MSKLEGRGLPMTSELEATLEDGEHMARFREWRAEAMAKHYCMSEWQITACLLLERHDRLRAALRVAMERFVTLDTCSNCGNPTDHPAWPNEQRVLAALKGEA